jgi:hypothetical protein
VIKTLEAQLGQFLLGCKCLLSRGIVMKEQDPLGDIPATRVATQRVLQELDYRTDICRVTKGAHIEHL